MRKSLLLGILLLPLLGTNCDPVETTTTPPTLTVYTYESLNADYGLLPQVLPQFEFNHNVKTNVITFPDAGVMLNQLIVERDHPQADVVIGLDNLQQKEITDYSLLSTSTLLDYGFVAFVYDTTALSFPEPISLMDLTDEKYKDQIIIEQPGLSSPGTQLLVWSNIALGNQAETFWKGLKPNVLTVAPDWSTAYYSMFLTDQAPIVLSYLTSAAFHEIEENSERYAFIPIKEGYIKQQEIVGIVNGTDNELAAQNLQDYLASADVQDRIATTQWMFPALETAQTPPLFNEIKPTADQTLSVETEDLMNIPTWITQWNSIFGN